MRQPLIIGYIVAGSCVGPGGLGLVLELVQVSSYLFLIGIQHDQALS
jgi:Kef-type K+ transport system membrane component KefB